MSARCAARNTGILRCERVDLISIYSCLEFNLFVAGVAPRSGIATSGIILPFVRKDCWALSRHSYYANGDIRYFFYY